MKLIDTHTHLYLPEFDSDRDEMIERAVGSGVVKLLMPNIDNNSVGHMLAAADRYKGICFPMIGLHPTSVKDDYVRQIDMLLEFTSVNRYIAVGEIGIDLYWDKTYLNEQMEAMRRQVSFALESDLPVVIHSRESIHEVFSVLDEFNGEKLTGVLHAFSGTVSDAARAIKMGFRLGIGGPLTYKNSALDIIVREAGIENIILETDSPYLTPAPHRGKRNESSYICIINKKLAEIFTMDEEETASITFKNSCNLFNI
ncbi:MAG: TatD family hydrolase [Bacteroidales bacterium]|jgi:TatD DNase family protein|nr:TatD family hydrolase [Bacteroidales bacterium]